MRYASILLVAMLVSIGMSNDPLGVQQMKKLILLISVFVLLPVFPVSADNDVDGKALFCQHKDHRPRTKDIGIVFKNGKSSVIFISNYSVSETFWHPYTVWTHKIQFHYFDRSVELNRRSLAFKEVINWFYCSLSTEAEVIGALQKRINNAKMRNKI